MIDARIFKANDIRGLVTGSAPEWDADGSYAIGAAAADVLGIADGRGGLVLGRDMRTTSPELSAAFARGMLARGADVVDIGLASTDQLWFASGRLGLPGAMFTASHNPGHDNGIKFCHRRARPLAPDELMAIRDQALAGVAPAAARPGQLSQQDLLMAYAKHLLDLVDLSGIRRLRIVVDAGNGMGGLTTPAVLEGQNLDLIGLYLDPDGSFPNHPPNPLEPENLVDAQAAVREHRADLGVVFDGDADRCFVIDERGEVVSPSAITAMIAVRELARHPGSTIVINKITSHTVPELVAQAGGTTVITRVGHTFVKAAMAEHDAVFGGEHSAHFYFRDFWGADTGMLAALHVLAAMGSTDQPLSSLVAEYSHFVASGEINSTVEEVEPILAALEEQFADRGAPDRDDGLTLTGDGWWVNVRPSNTEPLLRLNVEAPTAAQVTALRDEALAVIRS
ncbi:MAG: phosphomannomutase/phosphoglucomutase [Microlunatus sp.]|nr:phosphomannomutase/phosphoglucomutase [Microlunatus sp.]MDN5769412.1 phosphomannomutase/phosphoglucomutase [Microlunatus sp.]